MSPASSTKRSTKSNWRARHDEVVRIDRDAVAADARPGREAHEPERLGRRRVDHLPDIEPHPLAEERQLVDKAMFTLRKTFSRSLAISAASGDDSSTTRSLIRRRRAAARAVAGRRRRPDEARHVLRRAGRIARVDPLRREGEIEVAAGHEAAALEDLAERSGRRARERRGLEHDSWPGGGRRG